MIHPADQSFYRRNYLIICVHLGPFDYASLRPCPLRSHCGSFFPSKLCDLTFQQFPVKHLIQLDFATIVDDHVRLVGEIGEIGYLGSA